MCGRKLLLIAMTTAAIVASPPAGAQLSPFGIIGGFASHVRHMFGHFGHFPRAHHSDAAPKAELSHVAQDTHGQTLPPAGAGPAAWSNAFNDVLGFTFWPWEYAQQVRGHGFDVIAAAIVEAPRQPTRSGTTGASAPDSATAPCQVDESKGNWLTGRIEQTITLSPVQHDALDTLKNALAQSTNAIDAGCQDAASLSPIDRLNAATQRLWAVRDAGINIRAPLGAFYDSLSPAQKANFELKQPQNQQDAKSAGNGNDRQFQTCAAAGMAAAGQLVAQIEQKIKPSKDQAASVESLRKSSSDMAKLLSASCGEPVPADPLARLDAADAELSRLSYAATSEQIALNTFYAQLDGDQKAKFDSLGR